VVGSQYPNVGFEMGVAKLDRPEPLVWEVSYAMAVKLKRSICRNVLELFGTVARGLGIIPKRFAYS
jgi:hypothetical protein